MNMNNYFEELLKDNSGVSKYWPWNYLSKWKGSTHIVDPYPIHESDDEKRINSGNEFIKEMVNSRHCSDAYAAYVLLEYKKGEKKDSVGFAKWYNLCSEMDDDVTSSSEFKCMFRSRQTPWYDEYFYKYLTNDDISKLVTIAYCHAYKDMSRYPYNMFLDLGVFPKNIFEVSEEDMSKIGKFLRLSVSGVKVLSSEGKEIDNNLSQFIQQCWIDGFLTKDDFLKEEESYYGYLKYCEEEMIDADELDCPIYYEDTEKELNKNIIKTQLMRYHDTALFTSAYDCVTNYLLEVDPLCNNSVINM